MGFCKQTLGLLSGAAQQRVYLKKPFGVGFYTLKTLDRKHFTTVVGILLGTFVAILTSSFALSFYPNLRPLLGVWVFCLIASLLASLRPTFAIRGLVYVGIGIPLLLTIPLLILTTIMVPAFQIGWTTAVLLVEGAAIYFTERKHPNGFTSGELAVIGLLGFILSQLFLPWGIVYRTTDNNGFLDPWSTVTVYGNDTTGSAGLKLVFTSLSHQNFSTSVSYSSFGSQAYAINLPNRMNYTIRAPDSSPSVCIPSLVLDVDSVSFAFNFKC
jgi:hypothetical protein